MKTFNLNKLAILVVSAAFLFSAYAVSGMGKTDGDKTIPDPVHKSSGLTIKDILDGKSTFEGKEVTITARFMGWKGGCMSSMPMTRSDWIIGDSTGCIYVNGPLPQGLSALSPKSEPVIVSGVVMKGLKDSIIIKAKEVKPAPAVSLTEKKSGQNSDK